MAPFVKGDKCDLPIKIQMKENQLSLLQPLQKDTYKALVSTYTSEFPVRSLDAAKSHPYFFRAATELSKDANHFQRSVTETRHKYDEKLPFLEPTIPSDRVRLTSVQMHSDKRIDPHYLTSHKKEFPAEKNRIQKREKFVPSSETKDRILPGDPTPVTLISEQHDKFKYLAGEKIGKTGTAIKANQSKWKVFTCP